MEDSPGGHGGENCLPGGQVGTGSRGHLVVDSTVSVRFTPCPLPSCALKSGPNCLRVSWKCRISGSALDLLNLFLQFNKIAGDSWAHECLEAQLCIPQDRMGRKQSAHICCVTRQGVRGRERRGEKGRGGNGEKMKSYESTGGENRLNLGQVSQRILDLSACGNTERLLHIFPTLIRKTNITYPRRNHFPIHISLPVLEKCF